MRLIDADALFRKMEEAEWYNDADRDEIAEELVLNAPTIEERKTGKWERHYSRPNVYADLCWHCSCCGYKTPDNWANKWNYCTNCGAKMEGEEHG